MSRMPVPPLRSALLLAACLQTWAAWAQCTNNNTLTGTAVTPTCPGNTVVPCVQGGQYALVNVVSGNTYTFATCGGAIWDTEITLYNNAGGASLGYNDDGCGAQSTVSWTANFTGQLRVLLDLFPCASNTTCALLTITCSPPPPAATNDNPCNATTLTPATNCTNTLASNVGATATTGAPAPTCGNYLGGDVWFSVVVPPGGALTVNTSTATASALTDGGMAAYTATSCNGPFTQVACNDDLNGLMPGFNLTGLTPGSTVWLRFWEYGNDATGAFNICAIIPPPAPTNDNPCQATAVTVTSTCTYTTYSNIGTTSTISVPAPNCGFYFGADVWFSFVAPPSGVALIQTQSGTLTDADMAIYSAPSCNGPFTLMECDDLDGPGQMPVLNMTGLTPGQTYYVRVWGFGGAQGSFALCISGPINPPAGDCVYVLEMFDGFGDGWTGSTVGVSIYGGPFTTYTVTGSYNVALIGLNVGQVLNVQYTAVGGFQNEISYRLSFASTGQTVFFSGSPPQTGTAFTQTIDCNPPPSSPNDCVGGVTICNSLGINNNAASTGDVVDLTTANQGCLTSGERQGTWYYFSPSTGGTIGFTINPANPLDDYDFAVWGPLTGVTCPPPGPPLRCSYAAPSGATGMGNGATDASEGAGGDKWVSTITVLAGQVYLLYIDNFSISGQAFTLNWNLTNGASLDCTVLPIALVDLRAEALAEEVRVAWTMSTEEGLSHYLVERSADGVTYVPVGEVGALGMLGVDHAWVDDSPLPGRSFYRLALVGLDGGLERSPGVPVDRMAPAAVPPFPNPCTDELRWADPRLAMAAGLQVTDALGRIVLLTGRPPANGPAMVRVDGLPAGTYALHAVSASGERLATTVFLKR